MPKTAEPWSLTGLREKLIKIGAKVVSYVRYVTFQMAEVAVPRQMFAEILSLIARLRPPPAPACRRSRSASGGSLALTDIPPIPGGWMPESPFRGVWQS